MSVDDVLEKLKNLSGLVGAAAALIEKYYDLLPINPAIRKDMLLASCIAAVLTGFGAYQYAHRSHRQWLGWLFLVLFVVSTCVEIGLGHGHYFYLSPSGASLLAHIVYLVCFAGIGGAIGGFLVA